MLPVIGCLLTNIEISFFTNCFVTTNMNLCFNFETCGTVVYSLRENEDRYTLSLMTHVTQSVKCICPMLPTLILGWALNRRDRHMIIMKFKGLQVLLCFNAGKFFWIQFLKLRAIRWYFIQLIINASDTNTMHN